MTTFVLDSSAVLRYFDDGLGADRVEQILGECSGGRAQIVISAVQWGEIAGRLRKHFGPSDEVRFLGSLLPSEANIVSVSSDRAVRAADLKVDRDIAYADVFALELAMQSKKHILVTADYDFKAVEDLAHIEFLPAK